MVYFLNLTVDCGHNLILWQCSAVNDFILPSKHSDSVVHLKWIPNGSHFLTTQSYGVVVLVWEATSGKCVGQIRNTNKDNVCIDILSDGSCQMEVFS